MKKIPVDSARNVLTCFCSPNTVSVFFHTRIVSVLLAQSTVENKGIKLEKKKTTSPPPLRTIYISLFLCFKIWNPCVTSWCSRQGACCRNFTPRYKRIKLVVHPVVVHPEPELHFSRHSGSLQHGHLYYA